MKPESIIQEIHCYRENLARECGFDVKQLMNHYRKRESEPEAKGHELVSFVESAAAAETSLALHDKPSREKK